ncbi:MAG TPA: hypothetical protein ENH29_03055, partial [Bacteroidetes bacterium]|nr:hypothetical protein [Bacteroidota bacterium]
METISLNEEKRRYHRLQPTVEPEPRATFEVDERKIEVKVVNLSPGGLLCYVNNKDNCCKSETYIPKIIIKVPEKKTGDFCRENRSGATHCRIGNKF